MSRFLGITVSEVNIAVERMQRLGLLRIGRDGRWSDLSGPTTSPRHDLSTVAMRKLQRQILLKAVEALEEVPIDRRDQSSMTMAIHSELLPEAIERIGSFRRELCAFLKSKRPLDQVYQLSISLYPTNTTAQPGQKEEK